MARHKISVKDIAATLQWYEEMGVDEVVECTPVDKNADSLVNLSSFLKPLLDQTPRSQSTTTMLSGKSAAPLKTNIVSGGGASFDKTAPSSFAQLSDSSASFGQTNSGQTKPVTSAKKQSASVISFNAPVSPTAKPVTETSGVEGSHPAQACKTLEELREAMGRVQGCSLRKTATNMVFGDGNPDADVMLVGEAPGAEEDLQGLPFVGMSGQLLDKMFQAIGLKRSDLYITNIVPWRPPGNRQPTGTETQLYLPFVRRHIELVAPKVVVMVGGTSAKALLGTTDGIMKLRGRWYTLPGFRAAACAGGAAATTSKGHEIRAIPIYHPAYLLRSPGQKRKAWQDLLTISKAL